MTVAVGCRRWGCLLKGRERGRRWGGVGGEDGDGVAVFGSRC
ncbi:hypothetical protein Hdeb2414_s0011g00375161 [Helianthus debilis subsp. tardiflorus]